MLTWEAFLTEVGAPTKPSRKSDEDHDMFKKAIHGGYIPPSSERTSFLSRFSDWKFTTLIPAEGVSQSQAILQAKKKLHSTEGLGKFFDTGSSFQRGTSSARKDPRGENWEVTIEFKAALSQARFGEKETTFRLGTQEELKAAGFEKVQKVKTPILVTYHREVSGSAEEDQHKVLVSVAREIAPKAKELLSDISVDFKDSRATLDPETKVWKVKLVLQGYQTQPDEEFEKLGFEL